MPQLAFVIGWTMILAMLSSSMWLGQTMLVSLASAQGQLAQAEAQVPWAYAQVGSALATGVQSSPNAPLSSVIFGSGWSNNGEKATATILGDTQTVGGPAPLVAANLQQNPSINERRVAVDLTVSGGNPPVTVTQRLLYRVFNHAPWVELLGTQTLGAASDRQTAAGADNGGCAGAGAGCDANAVQAADDQRVSSGLTCTLGSNSGTCPAGNIFDTSSYSNKSWANGQTVEGTQ